ncbi:hypothetical protein ACN28S_15735 [Cystobacter fuscus]
MPGRAPQPLEELAELRDAVKASRRSRVPASSNRDRGQSRSSTSATTASRKSCSARTPSSSPPGSAVTPYPDSKSAQGALSRARGGAGRSTGVRPSAGRGAAGTSWRRRRSVRSATSSGCPSPSKVTARSAGQRGRSHSSRPKSSSRTGWVWSST